MAQIGVDEKAAAKGPTHVTLVCDLEQGTVEHIEAMAMDMWDLYLHSPR